MAGVRERFLAIAAAAGPPETVPSIAVDVALQPRDVDYALHRDLQRLAPCGMGNPEPLVAILGLTVTRARETGDGGHSQLVLKRRLDVLDGIAFGWPELAGEVTEGMAVDIVAQLKSRRFGGIESLQLDIRDAAPSGITGSAGDPRSAARRGWSRPAWAPHRPADAPPRHRPDNPRGDPT